jgi:hypothetical protein
MKTTTAFWSAAIGRPWGRRPQTPGFLTPTGEHQEVSDE